MKAIKFRNFSDRDFTWKYDGLPYEFKAGQEIFLEDFKAEHFAKHLVDRELDRLNVSTGYMPRRTELLKKCFPSDEVVTPQEAINIEEKKKEEIVKEVKAKKGKAKKVEVEEEFADLNK